LTTVGVGVVASEKLNAARNRRARARICNVSEGDFVRRSRHKVTGIQGIWSLSPL
jgi:hypothetical protein